MAKLILPSLLSACVALLALSSNTPLVAEAQAYPNCPLTGLPPKMTTVPRTRCLSATNMSCCNDCADIGYGIMLCLAGQFLCSLLSLLVGTKA